MNKLQYKSFFLVERIISQNINVHKEISRENDILVGDLSVSFIKINKYKFEDNKLLIFYNVSNDYLLKNKLKCNLNFSDKMDIINSVLIIFENLRKKGIVHGHIDTESIFLYSQFKIINKGFYNFNKDFTNDLISLGKVFLEILIGEDFDIANVDEFHSFLLSNYNIDHWESVKIYKIISTMIHGIQNYKSYREIIIDLNTEKLLLTRLSSRVIGRTNEYLKIKSMISNNITIFPVLGEIGVGKTLFILYTLKKLKKNGYDSMIIDCKRFSNKSENLLLSYFIDLLLVIKQNPFYTNNLTDDLELFNTSYVRFFEVNTKYSVESLSKIINNLLPKNFIDSIKPAIFLDNIHEISKNKLEFILGVIRNIKFITGLVLIESSNNLTLHGYNHSIELPVLNIDNYIEILNNSVEMETKDINYLANICYKKTLGNPLYLKELFKDLQLNSIIWLNPISRKMVISKTRINSIGVTDSQVYSILEGLNYFTKSQTNILKLAFAQGELFSLKILRSSSNLENFELIEIIKYLIENNIIFFDKGIFSEHYWKELSHNSVDTFFRFSNKKLYNYIGSLFNKSGEIYNLCYYISIKNLNMVKDLETNNILIKCLAKSWFLIGSKHRDLYINNFYYMYNYYYNQKRYSRALAILQLLKKTMGNMWGENPILSNDIYSNIVKLSYMCRKFSRVEIIFDALYERSTDKESLFPIIHYYLKSLIILGKEEKAYNVGVDFFSNFENTNFIFQNKILSKLSFLYNMLILLLYKRKYLIRSSHLSSLKMISADYLLTDFILVLNVMDKKSIINITNKVLSLYKNGGDGVALGHAISIYGLFISSFFREYKYIRIFNKLSKRIISRKENDKQEVTDYLKSITYPFYKSVDETKKIISDHVSNSMQYRDQFWYYLFSINKLWIKFITGDSLIDICSNFNRFSDSSMEIVPKSYSYVISKFSNCIRILQGEEKQYELSVYSYEKCNEFFSTELILLEAYISRIYNRSDYKDLVSLLYTSKKLIKKNLEETIILYLNSSLHLNNQLSLKNKYDCTKDLKIFRNLAENSPNWFQAKYLHLLGLSKLNNELNLGVDILEIAIEISDSNNNYLDAAIISEDVANYMLHTKNIYLSNKYLILSINYYKKWGATTKVAALQNMIKDIF